MNMRSRLPYPMLSIAVERLGGKEGVNASMLRFSHPNGRVTITSSKSQRKPSRASTSTPQFRFQDIRETSHPNLMVIRVLTSAGRRWSMIPAYVDGKNKLSVLKHVSQSKYKVSYTHLLPARDPMTDSSDSASRNRRP
jgi:hypothetical protein